MHKSRWFDACWLVCCLAASSAWCLTAARQLSATFDEPLYVERGLRGWRSGSHAGLMKLGTMPLAVDWDTLPLYVYERWTGTPIDPVKDLGRVLPWARAAALAFWWLLLAYGWLAGRSIAGPWGGRLAVVWLACEPNLLAHASLATTDIAESACLLALIWHFLAGRDGPWWRRVAIPGVWFAAAVLAKASGMVFGPLCLLAAEAQHVWTRRQSASTDDTVRIEQNTPSLRATLRSSLRDLVGIASLGFALTFVYCGSDWQPEPSFVSWAHTLPAGRGHDTMVWLAEHLRIFSNAGEGLVRQVKHNMRGHHGSYLLGQAYPRPVWYYFPVALTVKLALPILAAPFLFVRRGTFNWALAVALALFAFSLNCRVQIGIRLVLPLIGFLVIGLAAAAVAVIGRSRRTVRPLWVSATTAAVLWSGVAAWRVWPEGLCYTNELWGGTRNGYLCLSDSNYDWGQGLKELAAWPGGHNLNHLDVWYFGSDPAIDAAPLRHLPLHLLPIGKPSDVPIWVHGRYLAVSTTLLFGTPMNVPAFHNAIDYLRSRPPVARTSTFFIYDTGEAVVARSPDPAPSQR
ncbi:MAG TPA: glycosyltransferase family 39 protein [Pirellulales bacterium]|nr:glycosyltransferase family 39 protein [Pirellulales bacterium]